MIKLKPIQSAYLLLVVSMFMSATAYAGEAGRIVFVAGKAEVGGRQAVLDAAVQEGDSLATGADGYVYVKTVDKGFLILRPNSRARIVAYAIDSANPANTHVKLELSQGVARAISGEGVKQARQNFRFNTPVAAIGVRGTDFIVYTDQQASRVSVMSGGVVMSGFDVNCRAEGSGPCEGGSSRELFAGQAGLLQIERGKTVPQLLNNPALSPDHSEKPRGDEPVGKVTAPAAPVAEVNLDPQRASLSLESVRNTSASKPANPPVIVPPPVLVNDPEPLPPVVITPPPIPTTPIVVLPPSEPVPVTPPKPAVQEIFWGRWQSVAGALGNPGRIGSADTEVATYYGAYAMTRLTDSVLVMPKDGTVGFSLTGGEAVVTKSNMDSIGKVSSGQLTIDFAKRTFDTSLLVTSGVDRANILGSGIVTDSGRLYEDQRSPTLIRGYLGGPNAEEAGYLFKNYATPGLTISGVTLWKR